ncbi:MAG: 2,3-bisphosphoglycerate-independent phosphoglycerate mutase [Chloroflexi bacterium]|nr:2,3-bisphosphoglycerate-independent phosphoglycerate mutase [Chloroflexota bacterium]MBI3733370.1 2,3-bisphosphoglycerate-independent phosphoglycerate mutase [Chloroflexota bacterium]
MTDFATLEPLILQTDSKILLLVMDGLGGLPRDAGGLTELETARTPNMDALAAGGQLGLSLPIAPGVTPGSGPAHLSLFGYDPLKYVIGRGALEALGIGFPLGDQDVAARGNFCTVDAQGNVTDRRAGRIRDEEGKRLCQILSQIRLPGVEVFVEPVKEHRWALILRGEGLSCELSETDPGVLGRPPLAVRAHTQAAQQTADLVNEFIAQARRLLANEHPANMVLLRGFAKHPGFPTFDRVYGLRAGAVAVYPMYRGLASLLGMQVLDTGPTIEDEFRTVARHWNDFNFLYVHVKKTDTMGEDGNFDGKVHVIEEVDACLPVLTALKPDVIVITGDHSTPAAFKSHSWHPVPTLLASRWCRGEPGAKFGERACAAGVWGAFHATSIMSEALGHAGKLARYGA